MKEKGQKAKERFDTYHMANDNGVRTRMLKKIIYQDFYVIANKVLSSVSL